MSIKRILIECNHETAPFRIRMGWKNTLEYCGFQCHLWTASKKSAFDIFNEFKPDLFIGDSFSLSQDIIRCLLKYKPYKVAFYCSAFGEFADQIDPNQYPIVKISQKEFDNIKLLKEKINKPDLMFLHLTDDYVNPIIGKWQSELGIPVTGILTGADTFLYNKGIKKSEYECDIAFIGGYWQYKAQNLDKYIMPLCQYPFKYKTKIFGYNRWSCLNYLGAVKEEEQKNIFASANICPNIHESHSNDFGFDVVERIFKVPIAGGFLISDYVSELRNLFTKDEIPTFTNYQEFIDLIEYFLKNPEDRFPFIKKTREKILNNHTYFHRMSKLFHALNESEIGTMIFEKYRTILNKLL